MAVLFVALPFIGLGPVASYYYKKKRGGTTRIQFKVMLATNLTAFAVVLGTAFVMMVAQVYGNAVTGSTPISANERGMAFLAAGLVTGMCTIGTGIATGQAASAALGAISENENLMGKSLIFVALAEGIAIYGLLISFMILARV